MPGEKSFPMVKIMNEKADNCQVLQIFGDAKSLESALGLGLAKKIVELAEELPKTATSNSKSKDLTNEAIERDLDSIRINMNNVIKDEEEKIGELINEIDEFILFQRKNFGVIVRE
ncbi:15236_t:CDS:2, partial [Funneliformis geosporum]